MITKKIEAIIFDLGGVIIDLDIQCTINELAKLSGIESSSLNADYWHDDNFKLYETGKIDDDQFRSFLRSHLKYEGDDTVIDKAWNAMIFEIPAAKLELLKRLRQDYKLYLLSNTNTIHMKCVNERLVMHGHDNFDPFFDKQYYSHLINMRKPDADIYEFVLKDNNLKAENTLFIDDNADNIAGAANLGIQTLHIDGPDVLMKFFDE